jgi:DNA-binding response OmpR family regulator
MDEEIAMRAGANDYLRKPFDPDQLIVRVESLLEKSASGGGD